MLSEPDSSSEAALGLADAGESRSSVSAFLLAMAVVDLNVSSFVDSCSNLLRRVLTAGWWSLSDVSADILRAHESAVCCQQTVGKIGGGELELNPSRHGGVRIGDMACDAQLTACHPALDALRTTCTSKP